MRSSTAMKRMLGRLEAADWSAGGVGADISVVFGAPGYGAGVSASVELGGVQRTSIGASPRSKRSMISAKSFSKRAISMPLCVLPIRSQTTLGTLGWRKSCQMAKSSSLVRIMAWNYCANCQMSLSEASVRLMSETCSAWWPRASSQRASAGGSCASTMKRIRPRTTPSDHFVALRIPGPQ